MKEIPRFNSEEEEREYWTSHSIADHWDGLEPVALEEVPPRSKKKLISIRVDEDMLNAIKRIASIQRVPYQTLIHMWLARQLRIEQSQRATRPDLKSSAGGPKQSMVKRPALTKSAALKAASSRGRVLVHGKTRQVARAGKKKRQSK